MKSPLTLTLHNLGIRQIQSFAIKISLTCLVCVIFLLMPQTALADYSATVSGKTVTFTGDSASEVLTLGEQGGLLTHSAAASRNAGFQSAKDLDSTQPGEQTLALSQVEKIVINGGDGDDTMVINNPAGSVFAPNAVIWYDGGEGFDTLVLQGGGGLAFNETYSPGPTKDAGVVETTNGALCQVINFTGLEPLQDNVPAATLTVNGNPANNAINYSQGPGGGIFVGNTGLVSVDNFETIEFNNKTNLVINGQAGTDQINLHYNNTTNPAGLTGTITVNGGDPTDSDTLILNGISGTLDNLRYRPTSVGAGTVLNDNAPQPNVLFTGIEHLTEVVQQTDGDGVRVDGTTGNDAIEYFHGDTSDRGRFVGTMDQNNATGVGPFTMTEMSYTGISPIVNDSDVNFFGAGGTDSLVFNGTSLDDNIQITSGEAGGTDFRNTLNGILVSNLEVFNIATALVRGSDGNDIINVNVPAGPSAVALRVEGGNSDSFGDVLNFNAPTGSTTTINAGASTITSTAPAGNPVTFSGLERINETSSGGTSTLTVVGTASDETFNVTPTGPGAGSFVLPGVGSPLFTYTGVGGAFTIDGGVGADILAILGNDSADIVTSTASSVIRAGGAVSFNNIELINVSTFGGDDSISLTSLLLPTVVYGGDGNDTILGGSASDVIHGGSGNDILMGGGGADQIFGDDGDDRFGDPAVRDPAANDPGNDQFFGGDGSDQFFWDPGDGDDLVEGGAGESDQIFFFGNAGAEQFFVFANPAAPSRLHIFRIQAGIDIDASDIEQVNVTPGGGTDTLTVGRSDLGVLSDLASTQVRLVNVDLAGVGGGDGAADNVTVEGRPVDDNLLVSQPNPSLLKVAGLSYDVMLSGEDSALDRLTVSGNDGNDEIKAASGVEAAVLITLNGGAGDDHLSGSGILNGNDGNDTLEGGPGNDTMDGGAGDDVIVGNGGTDAVGGGAGSSVGDTILARGTVGNDTFNLSLNGSGHLLATLNGLTTTYTNFIGGPISGSGVELINVQGLAGVDNLTVDSTNGAIPIPINYDGGDNADTLNMTGGTATSNTYTVGSLPNQGVIQKVIGGVTQTVTFTSLEPAVDLVAGPLTINGNNANNAINYTQGSVATRGLVSIDNFEVAEFANKTTLTINGGAGSDTINLNNPTTPTGLTGITVNGGDPTGSDTLIVNGISAQLDNLRYQPTNVGAGTIINDNAPQPDVIFNGIEHLTEVVQQADGDGVRLDGTTGNDAVEFFHGVTSDSGNFVGTMDQNNATGVGPFPMTPMSFTGAFPLANDSDVNFFNPGGTDSLVFNGTSKDDNIQLAGGEAGGTDIRNTVNSIVAARLEVFNVASVLVRGYEGNDGFSVNEPAGPAATSIRIEAGDSDASTDVLNFTAPTGAATTIDLGSTTITSTGPAGNAVTYTGLERINETSSGVGSTLTVVGTTGDDTFNVTPTSAGAGSFVRLGVGGSPLITYTGVGGAFTINGGTGFDAVGILGNDGIDVVTSTASSVTRAGGTVTLGSGLEQLNISTFGGNDNITLTGLTIAKTIDAGTGNDTIDLSAAVDATIFGGSGDDTIIGSPAADYIDGGDGNDTITGGLGPDQMLGGAGSDKLIWNPGDGSDLVEGGSGTDELVFNGSAAPETFGITTNGARTTLTRSVGAITMDIGETEQLTVNGSDGDDIFNVAPQATAHITINGGNPVPPALPGDQLNIDLTGTLNSTKTPLGVGAGVWSFSNRQSVNFTGIETQGPAGPTISMNNVAVTEGNAGSTTATFTATLSAASAQTVSVDAATANGSAIAPGDYQSATATLTFLPGVTTANFSVQINGDTTPEGNETFTVNLTNAVNATISTPSATGTINDDDATSIFQFSSATATVAENASPGSALITITRTGDITGAANVKFETSDGTAKQRTDYTFGYGTVQFGPGEASKDVRILIVNDAYVEGPESFQVNLSSPSGNSAVGTPNGITVTITDDDVAPGPNPIDDAGFFVRQHYLDFLGREPDAAGLAFWTNNITSCGGNAACIDAKRVDTSAAFFLSIEYQETGAYVLRIQRAAFSKQSNDPFTRVTYLQFMRDSRQISQGVIVGQPGFATVLEANKQLYAEQVVTSTEFNIRFPQNAAGPFVDALFASANVTPTAAERTAAINAFGSGGVPGRIAALRSVVDSNSFRVADFSQAFVLSEYFGYLRRNPTDAPDFNDLGYQYWLNKLNAANGDFRSSEMVRSFILSIEYQQRFGP